MRKILSILLLVLLISSVSALNIVLFETFDNWNSNSFVVDYNGTGSLSIGYKVGRNTYGANFTTYDDGLGTLSDSTISVQLPQFSGYDCYTGFHVYIDSSKITSDVNCMINSLYSSEDLATFSFLHILYDYSESSGTWKFNNVDTEESIKFNSWNWIVMGYSNGTNGWTKLWVNGELIDSKTDDYSGYSLTDTYTYGIIGAVSNEDLEVRIDNIVISGEYPNEPEDWGWVNYAIALAVIIIVVSYAIYIKYGGK